MIEGRAIVESIEKAKVSVESLGGIFKSNYILKDIIFVPKKENYNLSDDFVRVRINIKSDWPTKRVILIRKQTEFKEVGKIDKTILRKEFDSEEEAFSFIQENLPAFKKGFEYEREGWQYQLNDYRIFIEDIKGWKPSIEVEVKDEERINEIFRKIGILELVKASVPKVMKQLLMK
jgi:adenylate cyclase class IV